jgi:putative sigma-54 modulation protein
MKVNMQSVKFKADQKLVDHIQQRMDKLEQFYDHVIDADVYLKVLNTNTRENKMVEIRLNIPGNDLHVAKEAKTFEEATDLVSDVLRRQLRKHKEKVRGV